MAGGHISYRIIVSNRGPSTARDLVVSDPLPSALADVTAGATPGTCAITAGVLTCTADELRPGSTMVIIVNALVDPAATGGELERTDDRSRCLTPDPSPGVQDRGRGMAGAVR